MQVIDKAKFKFIYVDQFGFETKLSGDMLQSDNSIFEDLISTFKRFLYGVGFDAEMIETRLPEFDENVQEFFTKPVGETLDE